jgi:hypothetical protein
MAHSLTVRTQWIFSTPHDCIAKMRLSAGRAILVHPELSNTRQDATLSTSKMPMMFSTYSLGFCSTHLDMAGAGGAIALRLPTEHNLPEPD